MWLPHERSMLRMLRTSTADRQCVHMSRREARAATPILRRLPFGVGDYGGHLESSGISCRGSLSESVQQCRGERVGAASVRQSD